METDQQWREPRIFKTTYLDFLTTLITFPLRAKIRVSGVWDPVDPSRLTLSLKWIGWAPNVRGRPVPVPLIVLLIDPMPHLPISECEAKTRGSDGVFSAEIL